MSTGNVSLDILLEQIINDKIGASGTSVAAIQRRFPCLSEVQAKDVFSLVAGALDQRTITAASVVVTAPPSFSIRAKSTKNTVESLIRNANSSILITGYSLSGYFDDLVDTLISKSQQGVFVKFFVNNISSQANFKKLLRYKGKFLQIYNYTNLADSMSALHAKVISVDQRKTLITSANLSYHGQEGNIELGTLIESSELAKQINDFFTYLIFSKVFQE